MARCIACSAPLAANTNRCLYCAVRNDVDLRGTLDYHLESPSSQRMCPHCELALQTISISTQEALFIERCRQCFGLFFDPGELETLLQHSVSEVFDINLEHIANINADRFQSEQKVRYIKCPECQQFMNRINYGRRSGVIVDRCKNHGVWLDSGEVTHLLEWKKAGGLLLHEKVAQKTQDEKKQRAREAARKPKNLTGSGYYSSTDSDIVSSVADIVFKLFD